MSSYDIPISGSLAPREGHTWIDEVKRPWRIADKASYVYCALESERHIRLLNITIEEPAPLPRLKVIHVPLDSAPDFEALSYCWGDDKLLYHIPIQTDGNPDTRSIPTTDSLATAMVFVPRSCSTNYIWIDQICINQQDDNERGHQIALMGEIYREATRVLVWLGPGLGVGNDNRQTSACFAGLQSVIVDDFDTDLEDLIGSDGVRDLLENEWYQRAWVVQESCFAREKRVLIGTFSIGWRGLILLADRVKGRIDISKFVFHAGTKLAWTALMKVEDNKPREFCAFLARFSRRFKAKDPKDKVLAFLGLWKPRGFDTKAATRREETAADIYTRFATSLIEDTKSLDILAAVDYKSQVRVGGSTTDALPSWVPGWEYDRHSEPSPVFQYQDAWNKLEYQWNASLRRKNQHRFESPIAKELRTRGRILWKIGCVSQHIKTKPLDPDNLAKTQQALGLDSGDLSIAASDALRILFLCKALKSAVNFTDFRPELKGPRGVAILRQCFPDAETGSGARAQIEGLPEYARTPEPNQAPFGSQEHSDKSDPEHSDDFEFACDLAFYRAIGRRFFKIQRPRSVNVEAVEDQVGLGPGCIETGDEIAILHGASFPVVLRKVEGKEQRYQLIGDCYVDGVMFGEAVDWEEEDADDIVLL